ncbi:MAG: hypothetical protein QXY70_03155 [Nanopusillaceae archaeon]
MNNISHQEEDFIEKSLKSLKDEWIYLVLVFIPWVLLLILSKFSLIKATMSLDRGLTPPILPLIGSELFISNIKINEWGTEIEYAIKGKSSELIMKIFSFVVVVYYFFIYSLYSGRKLKESNFILPIIIAFLFVLLIGFWRKLQYFVISIFGLILALVIPAKNDGFSFTDSFRESFRNFKENWLEMILLLVLVLGLYSFTTIITQEIGYWLLEFLDLSYEAEKIFIFLLLSFLVSTIITFQIILLTNYYLSKKDSNK